MQQINLDLGTKEVSFNGKFSVFFNPDDVNFLQRILSTYSAMLKIHEEDRSKGEAAVDAVQATEEVDLSKVDALLEVIDAHDAKLRAELDKLLGEGFCEAVFGDVSISARSGGEPLWVKVLTALTDQMNENVLRENAEQAKLIKKYTAKYRKKGRR